MHKKQREGKVEACRSQDSNFHPEDTTNQLFKLMLFAQLPFARGVDPPRPCWQDLSPFDSLRSPPRAQPTETKVESGTSHSKSGTSANFSNSGDLGLFDVKFGLLRDVQRSSYRLL